ncbi:MAG TPA: hypothetical protein VHL80_11065, partial [Polyangia bacterium]|nr:hypothetical protein [Polyangia bacterium]
DDGSATGGDASGLGGAGAAAAGGAAGTFPVMTYYISPDGSDGNPGTSPTAPWKTFGHALPALAPGSTLVLLDGTYTSGTTDLLQVFCGMNAVNGTPAQPITVRAMNERQAFILGNGVAGAPVELSACANWVLEGLHAEEADLPGETGDEPGSVFVITHCTNVVLRRLLGAHPNRYLTASVYVIAHGVANVLVEECEAVDFHYYGYDAYDSTRIVFRRDYAHSRDTPDVPGGQPTKPTTRGDGGFLLTKSLSAIIENCVAEDVEDGFIILASQSAQNGKAQPMRDQLLGDVANGVFRSGFFLDSQCVGPNGRPEMPCDEGDQIVSSATLSNVVSRGGAFGITVQGGVNNNVAYASIFDASDTGVSFSLDPINAGLQSSAYVHTTLVAAPSAAFGFHSTGQYNWSFTQVDSFGPAMSFVPKDSHLMNGTTTDPQLGACFVYTPPGSAAKAAGLGANIVYQTVDGAVTTNKLWDQTTGAFPCGAVVPGLNDASLSDVSCMGVGARLHVGAMGCAIP